MLTGKHIALFLLVSFSAVCVTLLAMPNVEVPCKVTLNYQVTRFVPTNKLAGEIRTVEQSKDFAGTGRMSGSRIVCNVTIGTRSGHAVTSRVSR